MEEFELKAVSQTLDIYRWKGGRWFPDEDVVAEEVLVRVFVNGMIYGSLVCSPWALDELTVGYLYTEGVLRSCDDVEDLTVEDNTVRVRLRECSPDESPKKTERVPCCLSARAISRLVGEMEENSALFRHTGGVHTAALSDGESILTGCEDVGRHNALDRLIGRCLLRGISMTGRAIIFSGRVPEEIVRKTMQTGCSAICSVSAPTSLAVETARAAGILLAGFVRGERFNVYSFPERVLI